jgi:hypothetical protein
MAHKEKIWNILYDAVPYQYFLNFIEEYENESIFLCGGCIRNIILGKVTGIKDLDMFVQTSENGFNDFLKRLREFGHIQYGQYGSPRLYISGDKEHYVDIVPFYNFIVSKEPINTIFDLLHNFDFTANALAINVKNKKFYDPVNGVDDIENRILRAVRLDFPDRTISWEIRISTLSVFWFRLMSYQAKLNFTFDEMTFNWLKSNKYRYEDLDMFKKYFFTPNLSNEYMVKLGIHDS